MNLKKKVGPLPVWAWGVLGGIAVYLLYVRSRGATTDTQTTADAQQLAADQLAASQLGQPAGGNLSTSGADNLNSFDSDLLAFLQAQTDFQQLAGSLGLVPAGSTTPGTGGTVSTPVTVTATRGAGRNLGVGKEPGIGAGDIGYATPLVGQAVGHAAAAVGKAPGVSADTGAGTALSVARTGPAAEPLYSAHGPTVTPRANPARPPIFGKS